MSGYFDGLMRSSGLAVSRARSIGMSAQPAAPLTETNLSVSAARPAMDADDATGTDVAVPAARPMIGPLDVGVRSVQQAMAAASVRAEASTAPRPPDIAAGHPFPTAALQSPPSWPHQEAADQSPSPASHRATALPSIEPSTEHEITVERIIQAAMRWVAAGSISGPAPSAASPEVEAADWSAMEPADRPSDGSATMPGLPENVATVVQPAETQVPPRPSAALPVPRAAAVPLQPIAPRSPRDGSVQVTIGEIHLRVEAPVAPAMQAAPATVQRPMTVAQSAPRSGLSRRALRRL